MSAPARLDRIAELLRENDRLRAELAYLKEMFAPPPHERVMVALEEAGIRLGRKHAVVLGLLLSREVVNKEQAHAAMYDGQVEEVALKIIDVFICQLRVRLRPANIDIQTVWGQGYRLSAVTKRLLLEGAPLPLPLDVSAPARAASVAEAPAAVASVVEATAAAAIDAGPSSTDEPEYIWGGSWGRR